MSSIFSNAQELIIGEERIEPGIVVIFEGAIKDMIMPSSTNLNENLTDIHIEARVNWDVDNIPEGTPKGGFVPYLHINALITNQKTGLKTFIDLIPHINLSDNFHYARNISLPGKIDDLYSVKYTISPPSKYDVSLHMDWKKEIGNSFFETVIYSYNDIATHRCNFAICTYDIAKQTYNIATCIYMMAIDCSIVAIYSI